MQREEEKEDHGSQLPLAWVIADARSTALTILVRLSALAFLGGLRVSALNFRLPTSYFRLQSQAHFL